MSISQNATNSSRFQVSKFILIGLPGIHEWQHWLSLPLALMYFLALDANFLTVITVHHEHNLHQPTFQFLSILAIVDIGLATTILAIFWFYAKAISLHECFTQIYAVHCFINMESGIFLCMDVDRYVAIFHSLQYSSIVTEAFVVKATVFMMLRNVLLTIPVPVLAFQRHYCSKNEIDHCMCSNPGVTGLACDDITINRFYQLALAWILRGNDMILVFISYVLIFHSVLRLNFAEAIVKALSTCSSHLILIFVFYTTIVVVSIAHLAGKAVPIFSVLRNVLNIVIPPVINTLVYALRAQELRVGFQWVFWLDKNMSQK
ncbi:olfactory receptor 688-like [Hyaena hyaena]|uniref:olfactory receptor 688-like n=1 Tax=Hyaena hyaena TaxID=95912 RepID=UPI00192048C7|nr:olfactory receptor 688-like [Hyaena hyaena]